MKTFETEKHNIPEGATHYSNETTMLMLCWFMESNGKWWVRTCNDAYWHECEHNENERYDLSRIPQTNIETPEEKDVEWVNGDECISTTGYKFTFIGLCNYSRFDCILLSDMGVPTFGFVKELSKPETPQQREERERLEAAYDLYLTRHLDMSAPYHYDEFLKNKFTLNGFLAIVDKTNYRKESE